MPILHLKGIIRLCKSLWYQKESYLLIKHQSKVISTKKAKYKLNKIEPKGKMAKNCYLYAAFSQKTLQTRKSVH